MHQKFFSIPSFLAHLRLPVSEATEGFCLIGQVSPSLADDVRAATGLRVEGFEVVIDRSGVQHALKQHGFANAASEIAQGQVPIEEADFLALPEWLLTPELVCRGQVRPGRQPMPGVEFYASLPTGRVCAVLEFRPGRKRLALLTMYKKRPTA